MTTTTLGPVHLSSRRALADYCLRKLGAPVIEINVDEQQVEDRIQDAIEWHQEYHFDGTERMYLKSLVVASTLTFTSGDANLFTYNEVLTGSVSGATCRLFKVVDATHIDLKQTVGTFVAGETVTGTTSGHTAIIAANGFVLNNWDKQFFEISDSITSVTRIFVVGPGTAGVNTRNIFDVVYQFRLNDMYDLMSTDLIYYTQVKMHLSLLDMLLPAERSIRYNRKMDQLFIDMNWSEQLLPGTYIIAEVYRALDPEVFTKVYNDYFIKRYASALIKRQWANNLKKFGGIQLPGGVVLNGKEMYDEAMEEIKDIEADAQSRYELPPFFEIG